MNVLYGISGWDMIELCWLQARDTREVTRGPASCPLCADTKDVLEQVLRPLGVAHPPQAWCRSPEEEADFPWVPGPGASVGQLAGGKLTAVSQWVHWPSYRVGP